MSTVWKIYKATGKCGRGYVGLTQFPVSVRWRRHVVGAKNGYPGAFAGAIRKYGAEWFTIQELCECYSLKEAEFCERAMIALHDTYIKGNGFNLTIGGQPNSYERSPRIRKLISASLTGRKQSPEHAAKSRAVLAENKWKLSTPERCEKMSKAFKELWNTPEKLSERRALMASPEVRANKCAAMRKVVENMTPERREERRKQQAEQITKANKDPAVKHLQWANREYEKALAARIGHERPYRNKSDRGRKQPQTPESIAKAVRTKTCNRIWRLAMKERSIIAHKALGTM